MKKTVTSDQWRATSEPQAALLDVPEVRGKRLEVRGLIQPATSGLELPEHIAARRERILRQQIDGSYTSQRRSAAADRLGASDYFEAAPPEPRWDSEGLADWRAQQRAARRCAVLLGILLLGGFTLIGLAAIAAKLGWL